MTVYEERCAREDELDRLEALRSTPQLPLPSCPPHLLFLCETMEDVAGSHPREEASTP